MLIEWVGGPVDGTMIEAPEGTSIVNIEFLLPYSIAQVFEDGYLPTRTVSVPVDLRNGKYYIQYPIIDYGE